MPLLSYSRREDLIDHSLSQPESVPLDSLLGTWVNTKPSGVGIAKFDILTEDGSPVVRIFGSVPDQ